MFSGILGIGQRNGTAGYKDVIINPTMLPKGEMISGSIETPNGVIEVMLDCKKTKPTVTVKAPEGIKISFCEKTEYKNILIRV